MPGDLKPPKEDKGDDGDGKGKGRGKEDDSESARKPASIEKQLADERKAREAAESARRRDPRTPSCFRTAMACFTRSGCTPAFTRASRAPTPC